MIGYHLLTSALNFKVIWLVFFMSFFFFFFDNVFLFYVLVLAARLVGSQLPDQGLNLHSLH